MVKLWILRAAVMFFLSVATVAAIGSYMTRDRQRQWGGTGRAQTERYLIWRYTWLRYGSRDWATQRLWNASGGYAAHRPAPWTLVIPGLRIQGGTEEVHTFVGMEASVPTLAVSMHLAWPVSLSAAMLAWCFVRRRRRGEAGHCPRCGYDLRATPERCPECGFQIEPDVKIGGLRKDEGSGFVNSKGGE